LATASDTERPTNSLCSPVAVSVAHAVRLSITHTMTSRRIENIALFKAAVPNTYTGTPWREWKYLPKAEGEAAQPIKAAPTEADATVSGCGVFNSPSYWAYRSNI
jgi:hypothetical protein